MYVYLYVHILTRLLLCVKLELPTIISGYTFLEKEKENQLKAIIFIVICKDW